MIETTKEKVILGKRYEYSLSDRIGQGSYAKVYRGIDLQTEKVVAIKVCAKQKMDEEEEIALQKQIHIMRELNHPNIVSFYDVYKDKKFIYLVLEYLQGGQLYEHILEKQTYSEEEAKTTILPILDALRYLHQVNIIHRDLKPENIVYTSKDGVETVKIIDFGVSQIISNQTVMSTAIGTPLYMAPQIFQGEKYRGAVDIWSLGVVLYVLFCGYPPFQSQGHELQNQIKNGEIQFQQDDWIQISINARDLVKKMLQKNPQKRITMKEIYSHPWIVQEVPQKKLTTAKVKLHKAVKKVRNALKAINTLKAFTNKK